MRASRVDWLCAAGVIAAGLFFSSAVFTKVDPGGPSCRSAVEATRPVRILPLGDSITQGGRAGREEYTYRYPLYYMLRGAGYSVDFIGSSSAGLQPEATWPDKDGIPFDRDHEGHYGWTTAQVRDKLPGWVAGYAVPPDIALIHLGSNDYGHINYFASIVSPYRDIIATLRRANPHVVILMGHMNEHGIRAWIVHKLLAGLARWETTKDSPVVTVPHYKGWREDPADPSTDTFDWAHPNPQGQQKMAAAWFGKMKPYLDTFRTDCR
jgi:lysophospholipase L1-like esterase